MCIPSVCAQSSQGLLEPSQEPHVGLAGTGTDREHVCALTHMERDLRVQ